MDQDYRLWFGQFRGTLLMSVMFLPNGWDYLKGFIADKLVLRVDMAQRVLGANVKAIRHPLVIMTKELLARGENLRVVRRCPCGQPAKYFVMAGERKEGYTFFRDKLHCEACKPDFMWGSEKLVEIKFSAIGRFRMKGDKAKCLEMLRWLIGLDGRLTRKSVSDYWEAPPLAPTEPVKKLLPPGSWMGTLAPEMLEEELALLERKRWPIVPDSKGKKPEKGFQQGDLFR